MQHAATHAQDALRSGAAANDTLTQGWHGHKAPPVRHPSRLCASSLLLACCKRVPMVGGRIRVLRALAAGRGAALGIEAR